MKNLEQKIIIAGFGGQGVVKLGHFIAYAHHFEGRTITEMISYGPEMRGGTANSQIRISKKKIGSPFVNEPNVLIAMNQPSLEKFEPLLQRGGLLIYNSSLISHPPIRADIEVLRIPATETANELGNVMVANVVLFGAYVEYTKSCDKETILEKSLLKVLEEEGKSNYFEINTKAFLEGVNYVRNRTK